MNIEEFLMAATGMSLEEVEELSDEEFQKRMEQRFSTSSLPEIFVQINGKSMPIGHVQVVDGDIIVHPDIQLNQSTDASFVWS